ncbi:hypothetical protein [Enterococcus saccharolyticus]|uniref:Uncharacterized protein n=1 Tax=Enterococcus saccharolyticus subsp. saccharolyticus ATCC 43076 TaxID=1139996 RepID=S0J1Z6_9ENTE|nr:hypothetical protein [Enterococcus saccharolyticus]EOT26252.1 hypothetical protein OMQ_02301 [Enterococcus saccharolyticus subsp. saccharolyticus ATCC 43076]EOT82801.1 hypothetical protein I572_00341 [Enterococcus saccharolyticus subsp. saccharolyticus ATCC 43076]
MLRKIVTVGLAVLVIAVVWVPITRTFLVGSAFGDWLAIILSFISGIVSFISYKKEHSPIHLITLIISFSPLLFITLSFLAILFIKISFAP